MATERSHATILFTDIVGSTERANELGDRAWRLLLRRYLSTVRATLRGYLGTRLNTAGDGFVASFADPVRAILCATALANAARDLGLELRSGLHIGQIEGSGAEVTGIAVHIGARIASQANPGEILVSGAVRDSVQGQGFSFVDLGSRELRGVEGEWRVYRLRGMPADVGALEPQFRERFTHAFRGRRVGMLLAIGAIVALAASLVLLRRERRRVPLPVLVSSFAQLSGEPGVEDGPSLAPDGEWVVYAGEGATDRDIFLRAVGGQRPIALTGDVTGDDSQPVFSPDGTQIAFRSERDSGGIFIMGRTGEGVRRVTQEGFNPTWSSDGNTLAYSLETTGIMPLNGERKSEIRTVSVEGGQARRVTETDADALDPAWSPVSDLIAYTQRRWRTAGTGMDIETVSATRGGRVKVTDDAFNDWSPAWSADGRSIHFISDRGGSMNLWRVPVDPATGEPSGPPSQVGAPGQFIAHPSISADGRRLAFSNVVTTSQNVQKADFDAAAGTLSNLVWLTSGTRRWANPDPNSDGTQVVMYSQDRPEGDLYLLQGDGANLRQLTDDGAIDRVPRWSNQDNRILYFSDRSGALNIWMIRPDGSDNRQVSFEDGGVGAWSPDDSRIAAVSPTVVHIFPSDGEYDSSSVERLPPDSARHFAVNDWSMDGEMLIGSEFYQDTGIILYSFREEGYRRLTESGQWPVWLPDGRHVLYVTQGQSFRLLDVETGEVREVYSSQRDVLGPPRLDSDADAIYFTRRTTDADIWVAEIDG